MALPDQSSPKQASFKVLAPWSIFAAVLLAAIVAFFYYADRVPSLLQSITDR